MGHAVQLDLGHVRITPASALIGGKLRIEADLHNPTQRAQRVLADLQVHYVKASGEASPKVFKLSTVDIAPGDATCVAGRITELAEGNRTRDRLASDGHIEDQRVELAAGLREPAALLDQVLRQRGGGAGAQGHGANTL